MTLHPDVGTALTHLAQTPGLHEARPFLAELGKAAAKKATDAIADGLVAVARAGVDKFHNIAAAELRRLLSHESKGMFDGLLSERRGLLVVGPSGSGKTALAGYIADGVVPDRPPLTTALGDSRTRFGKRILAVSDAPGDHGAHVSFSQTFEALAAGPRLLVLVLAYGYLDTDGMPALNRPRGEPASSLANYLGECRAEEERWLDVVRTLTEQLGKGKAPRKIIQANNAILVINKRDLWADEEVLVRSHYTRPAFVEKLQASLAPWSANTHPELHMVACDYDNFKNTYKAPSSKMSRIAGEISRRVLRAQLALMLDQQA